LQVDDDDKSDVDDDDMEVAGGDGQLMEASKAGQDTAKQNKSVRMSVAGRCCGFTWSLTAYTS
jgi:hypothetical protein